MSKNKKNIIFFSDGFSFFTTEKNLCILHGHIFVMLFLTLSATILLRKKKETYPYKISTRGCNDVRILPGYRFCFPEATFYCSHYENMPMQYKEIFKVVKNENFPLKNFDIFLIFAQNIDCGYTLEAVLTSTHNLCFGAKIRKIGIPLQTPVLLYKSGV